MIKFKYINKSRSYVTANALQRSDIHVTLVEHIKFIKLHKQEHYLINQP